MKALVKTYFIVAGLLIMGLTELEAQPYRHAVGIRAGYSSGISYKGFMLHRMSAFQFDFLYNRHGLNLSALYAYHLEPFQKSSRTFFYLGGGPFGGQWEDEFSVGLAALAGIIWSLIVV